MCLSLFAVVLFLSGCTATHASASASPSTASSNRGHLVIVGGGLDEHNAEIHNRFVSLCTDGPIGIIPIASGDGLKAGEEVAAGWRPYAGSRPVIVIPLTKDDIAKADDPTIAAQIASCGGLWFTGGDQSRVTAVMKSQGRRSATLDACFQVLSRDGVIGGTSAGAALMSDPMITGGQSRGRSSRSADETESTVTTAPGMGFLSGALTDQHFLERGRMGRLMDAMQQTEMAVGLGVRENSALVVHRASGECEAIGRRAVCVISAGTKPDPTATSARLSILSSGDRFMLTGGRVIPASTRTSASRVSSAPGDFLDAKQVRDPWEMHTMEDALDKFTLSRGRIIRENDRIEIGIAADGHSDMWLDNHGSLPPCLENLLVTTRPARQTRTLPSR